MALAYGAVTYQLRHDGSELRDTVAELDELCDRYDFAYYREWGLVLGGWCRDDGSGIGLAQQGIKNLKSDGSFARMPYWLSLLAELYARDDRPAVAAATLDAALVGGQARRDLWWMPEVMRMRAGYDGQAAAVSRLRRRRRDGAGTRQRRAAPALRARPRRAGRSPVDARRSPAPVTRARTTNAARTPRS